MGECMVEQEPDTMPWVGGWVGGWVSVWWNKNLTRCRRMDKNKELDAHH